LKDGALNDATVNQVFLEKASKSINRLVLLVEDLDEISKYESNEIKLKKEPFIIQDLIKEVFEELRFKQKEKGIHLLIKQGCEKSIQVFGDINKIRQVLVNLLDNSIKYGKENGETNAGIYEVDDKTVLVEINDNGYGISEEHVPRIFERFYRTDLARSRKVGGSGLGLSIVKHIVEGHAGNVYCRSAMDVGTTIGFTISKVH
jgi:two-component system, OmpR family, phosphate regulon sensor histidine kinase PhoR